VFYFQKNPQFVPGDFFVSCSPHPRPLSKGEASRLLIIPFISALYSLSFGEGWGEEV